MPNYWINTVTRASWEREKRENRYIVGSRDRLARSVKSMRDGDYVIYYISGGECRFGGTFRVRGEYYYDEERFWNDDIFPHRIDLDPITVANKEEQEVEMRPHLDNLNFIEKKRMWGCYFLNHLRKIPREDFDYLEKALRAEQR